MHPILTFDLVQQDHRERLEAARLLRRAVDRQTDRRPGSAQPDHPPEPVRPPRPWSVLAATTTVAAVR